LRQALKNWKTRRQRRSGEQKKKATKEPAVLDKLNKMMEQPKLGLTNDFTEQTIMRQRRF